MGMKLEDVDILDALNRIVELNTHHYKDDFDLDKELIPKHLYPAGAGGLPAGEL